MAASVLSFSSAKKTSIKKKSKPGTPIFSFGKNCLYGKVFIDQILGYIGVYFQTSENLGYLFNYTSIEIKLIC